MQCSLRAALLGLAAACTAACGAPNLRIPFPETGSGLHVSVLGGERATNSRYHGEYSVKGVEVTSLTPGTEGWGWDMAFRWGETSGEDGERITNPPPTQTNPKSVVANNVRNSDIYELSLGVRQMYFPESRLQPYFGVGGSFFKTQNSDHYTGTDVAPDSGTYDLHKHFQTCALGMYMSLGVVWNVLRDQVYDNTEFVVDLNVRGLLGDEFSFVEVALGFGFGK